MGPWCGVNGHKRGIGFKVFLALPDYRLNAGRVHHESRNETTFFLTNFSLDLLLKQFFSFFFNKNNKQTTLRSVSWTSTNSSPTVCTPTCVVLCLRNTSCFSPFFSPFAFSCKKPKSTWKSGVSSWPAAQLCPGTWRTRPQSGCRSALGKKLWWWATYKRSARSQTTSRIIWMASKEYSIVLSHTGIFIFISLKMFFYFSRLRVSYHHLDFYYLNDRISVLDHIYIPVNLEDFIR